MENVGKQGKSGKTETNIKKQGVTKEDIGKQWKAEGIGKQRDTGENKEKLKRTGENI